MYRAAKFGALNAGSQCNVYKQPVKVSHIVLAVLPVALTPAFIVALADGWIDFGGGEKDILIALPYFLLTLFFFITGTTLIVKRWDLRRWVIRSSVVSVGVLLGLGVMAYFTSLLGVA